MAMRVSSRRNGGAGERRRALLSGVNKGVETRSKGDTGYRAKGVPVARPPAVTERVTGVTGDIQSEAGKEGGRPV